MLFLHLEQYYREPGSLRDQRDRVAFEEIPRRHPQPLLHPEYVVRREEDIHIPAARSITGQPGVAMKPDPVNACQLRLPGGRPMLPVSLESIKTSFDVEKRRLSCIIRPIRLSHPAA